MARLGFDGGVAVGHDRGARVVHRMCLDHAARVSRAAVLDIVPTRHVFATVDMAFAMAYEHWFFLAQPPGFPERLIGADPEFYLRAKLAAWSAGGHTFDEAAVDQYVTHFRDPAAIAASCEDYRAAASIDLDHDEAGYAGGDRVTCPLLVMWGTAGVRRPALRRRGRVAALRHRHVHGRHRRRPDPVPPVVVSPPFSARLAAPAGSSCRADRLLGRIDELVQILGPPVSLSKLYIMVILQSATAPPGPHPKGSQPWINIKKHETTR
jgi:pimeloyl-ACP methyl ester carboxylesterase